jgi:hypothetical protein
LEKFISFHNKKLFERPAPSPAKNYGVTSGWMRRQIFIQRERLTPSPQEFASLNEVKLKKIRRRRIVHSTSKFRLSPNAEVEILEPRMDTD